MYALWLDGLIAEAMRRRQEDGEMDKLGHVLLKLCVQKQVWYLICTMTVCLLFARTF